MFDKQYRFRGRHALRVDALTSVFDNVSKAKIFERNVDVYTNAPLVGFLARFGFQGPAQTLEEVGQVMNVTREKIRQIEAKAIRKLSHLAYSKKLKELY